jgi:hypothetical protein
MTSEFSEQIGSVIPAVRGQPVYGGKTFDQTVERATIVAAFPTREAFVNEQSGRVGSLSGFVGQRPRAP